MTGAPVILEQAAGFGAGVCFANPGTTELPLVRGLEKRTDIRSVLCLFEGVCTGAADGYFRMSGTPALTLTHLGPGFANGMANLHNARRARSGIVNIVGDHPADHLPFDSPLTSDIESMARTVSDWVRTTAPDTAARDALDALEAAATGRVATLITPVDAQEIRASEPVSRTETVTRAVADLDSGAIADAAAALTRPGGVLLLGGQALRKEALCDARRVQQATGCRVMIETFPARHERGEGIPSFPSVPYFPEVAAAALADTAAIVLVGAPEPIGTFAVPGVCGRLTPAGAARFDLGITSAGATLAALVEVLRAPPVDVPRPRPQQHPGDGLLTAPSIGHLIAASVSDGAVVVEEAATNGWGYAKAAATAAPHVSLGLTGGAIGIGLPLAVGAAVATGGRVIALQADGSAMYTNQAMWTMAREGLDVTIVLLANHRYAILQAELARIGAAELGPVGRSLTELDAPAIDWVALAGSMGIPGTRCRTNDELAVALARSGREQGPALIEADLTTAARA